MSAAVKKKVSGPALKLVPPKAPPPAKSAAPAKAAAPSRLPPAKLTALPKPQPSKAPLAKPAVAKAPAPTRKHEFKAGDFIVYPTHGVGRIQKVDEKEVAGNKLELFVIAFDKDKMILSVPTAKAKAVGMRKLSSPDVVAKALDRAGRVGGDGLEPFLDDVRMRVVERRSHRPEEHVLPYRHRPDCLYKPAPRRE